MLKVLQPAKDGKLGNEIENYILKAGAHWSLIQLDFERPRIKLASYVANKSILVDNKLYGQFHNLEFKRSLLSAKLQFSL